jgi:hypothetical protein
MVIVNGLDTIRDIFIKHGDVVSERPDTFMTKEMAKSKGISYIILRCIERDIFFSKPKGWLVGYFLFYAQQPCKRLINDHLIL